MSSTPGRGALRRLLQLNVLLALGASSVVAATALLAATPVSRVALLAAFCGVFAVYNFDRLADDSPAEGRSTPERRAAVLRSRSILRLLIPLALVIVAVSGATAGLGALAWALAFPLLGVLYVLPVLPVLPLGRVRRLKDVPLLKSFYVPACWCAFVGLSIAASDGRGAPAVWCFAAFVYLRCYVSGYLGDIRDADDDAQAGVRTLAQKLGVARSHRLLKRLHLASVTLVLLAVVLGFMPSTALGLLGPAALGYAIYRAFERHPSQHERLFELYDLELVSYAPSLLLLG